MQLYQAGHLADALAVCRQILTQTPDRADVLGFAGMIALKLGRSADAVDFYQTALALRPDHAEAHYNLGNALKHLNRLEDAASAYRRAAEIRPDLAPAHHNLGGVLQALDRFEEAATAYRRTLEIMPGSVDTLRNLGIVLHKLGRPDEAKAVYLHALEIEPGSPALYSNLVGLLIEQGEAGAAVERCNEWLALDPGSTEALAHQALALIELGDREAARELLDFDRFVKEVYLEAPPGYPDLKSFNRALAEHVCRHPTLKVPPEDDPTYHHPSLQITEELLAEPKGPVADLERMIHRAIEAYRREVMAGPDHPFLAAWPARWRISSWAVVLDGEGNLVPHIHLDGYLGGVYYPEMPDVVSVDDASHAGWFELGRPPPELHCKAEPEVRPIVPAEGKMLLFPAYLYHRTLPFESNQRRISIAFDLVPEQ
ncbi:MAG: tetratricopeptide repeat protein [Alphaproteobacteria bacterium]|nr:tetratricopeptide repeat protein [Alphaproteobacteria bacterium]